MINDTITQMQFIKINANIKTVRDQDKLSLVLYKKRSIHK